MKYLGITILALAGMYVGFYLATTLALDTFIRITPPDSPVIQDMGFSEGQTKMFPDYQVQQAASVQSTVGME